MCLQKMIQTEYPQQKKSEMSLCVNLKWLEKKPATGNNSMKANWNFPDLPNETIPLLEKAILIQKDEICKEEKLKNFKESSRIVIVSLDPNVNVTIDRLLAPSHSGTDG